MGGGNYMRLMVLIGVVVMLSACQSGGEAGLQGLQGGMQKSLDGAQKAGAYQLSAEQVALYQAGVKEILPAPETASFQGVRALEYGTPKGVHICGYVGYSAPQKVRQEVPFYVELRQEDGKPLVHRGQVGTDEAKRAKVKFVCRGHEKSGAGT